MIILIIIVIMILLLLQEVAPVLVPGKQGKASSPVMTDDALQKVRQQNTVGCSSGRLPKGERMKRKLNVLRPPCGFCMIPVQCMLTAAQHSLVTQSD